MNTQQSTVTNLLDPEWIAVVEEHLQTYPTAVALVIEPAILGQYHAQLGLPCDPYHYARPSDWDDYLIAYNDTVALWAEMVQAKNDEVAAARSWMDGELQELIDGREDEDFWRQGAW
jgi:hypothetical protein